MFNPANSSKKIKEEFIDYISTTFSFANKDYNRMLEQELKYGFEDGGGIGKGPIVDIKDVFESSIDVTIGSLADRDVLSKKFYDLERLKKEKGYKIKLPITSRPLYKHQEKAIDVLVRKGQNTVITTGTGSGKTECFLIPVINELLRELETVNHINGVRALLIYPMNALANDQMKRLREILMFYPDITFGVLNGDTKKKEKDAVAAYRDLHGKEDYKELQEPLVNEYISREKMWQTPPNILCTNYAMLEHLLLRPESDKIFADSEFKFIVLDEAHVYSGATGMETALLLRRLMARINYTSKPKFVLTSATLGKEGESEESIIKFANNLTGEKFDKSGIVFGKRVSEDFSNIQVIDYPLSLFEEVADCEKDDEIIQVLKKYSLRDDDQLLETNLYDICKTASLYKKLRTISGGDNLIDIKSFSEKLGINELSFIKFIAVCTKCFCNGKALIDARYHFFIRTLEGLYGSFCNDKKIYLERKAKTGNGDSEQVVFEISLCKTCGEIAIVGTPIKEDKLTKVHQVKLYKEDKKPIKYYHIINKELQDDDEFEDDELADISEDTEETMIKTKSKRYTIRHLLCMKCGSISEEKDGYPKCKCGKEHSKEVLEYVNAEDKCSKCKSGNYNRFYLGNDAATAVIATSLFEDLPIRMIKEKIDGIDFEREGGKQFLAFSDSRSEAAFFASYLGKSYFEFLRRRGIIAVVEKFKDEIIDEPWNLEDLVKEVEKLFVKKRVFINKLAFESNVRELKKNSIKNAWIAVLVELVNARRKTSLTSLGILKFEYAGNSQKVVNSFSEKYDIDKHKCKVLLDELAMSFAYFGAITSGDSDELDLDDKKYIYYSTKQKSITLLKDSDSHRTIGSWCARNKEGKDTFYKNVRQKLVMDALGFDEKNANEFLRYYFENVLINPKNDYKVEKGSGSFYFMPARNFIVRVNGDTVVKWYKCEQCNKITTTNITGKCNVYKCEGELREVDTSGLFKNNHYLGLYYRKLFTPIIIKEHTAQLSREEGLEYQQDFEKNRIHALSCSTTFEMGVDVGDLETVFLRNVPPTSANYAQRAGRAGRSKNAAAYALTYAKLSSHDFNYFKKPNLMINGFIRPPQFKIDNEKILWRHVYAVVLSCFFGKYKNYFNENNADVFLNQQGYEELINFVKSQDKDLVEILEKSFGSLNEKFGISKFSWVDRFIGENGVLSTSILDYKKTIEEFETVIKQFEDSKKPGGDFYRRRLADFMDRQVIDFLTRANVLPKYGFPVDTVELEIAFQEDKKKTLNLTRDLKLAISEYAPGEKIVANDKLYTSRFIKQSFRRGKVSFYDSYVCQCENCQTWNHCILKPHQSDERVCVACGEVLPHRNWMAAIEPRNGFVTDGESPREVPMRKPDKLYSNEDSYIGDQKEIKKFKYCSDNHSLILCSTENDEIMVTSKTNFYVCKFCGFTYGVLDRITHDGKKDRKAMEGILAKNDWIETTGRHRNSRKKVCESQRLYKNVLNHIFKTDVLTIEFASDNFDAETVMSAMYAILNAISNELNIERTDISGCVKFVNRDDYQGYSIVLYDAVAGGAGHVKRLLDSDGNTLRMIFSSAYESMNCSNCDTSCYSCLRNYQNQRVHDKLDRNKAQSLLSIFRNTVFVDEIAPNIQKKEISVSINRNSGIEVTNQEQEKTWKYVLDDLIEDVEKSKMIEIIEGAEQIDAVNPDIYDVQIEIDKKLYVCDLIWFEKRVMLLSETNKEVYDALQCAKNWKVYCINENLNVEEFLTKIKES